MHIVDNATLTPRARVPREVMLPLPPRLLSAIAIDHSIVADLDAVAEPEPGARTSARVHLSATHDIWLIRWGAASATVLHDHGGSAGALYVVRGNLVERRPNPAGAGRPIRREISELDHRPMAPSHVHVIANETRHPAASIHVYSPPLETMQHYEVSADAAMRVMRREAVGVDTFGVHAQAAHR